MKKIINEWKSTILLGILILILALGLRLYNLTYLPIFADEAIYIRWAQIMQAESTLRFLPLSDGKQPLFMWGMIPFLKIFKAGLRDVGGIYFRRSLINKIPGLVFCNIASYDAIGYRMAEKK